ncbi:MAG: hypothetical protein R3A80_13740 [Bdellovibrionota bacterium]
MNKIKSSGIILSFILTGFLHAEEGNSHKGEVLSEVKAHALTMIDKRIASLQETKSCINSAQSRDDLKKCREDKKSDRGEFKAEREKFRSELKEKRARLKAQREEKKS